MALLLQSLSFGLAVAFMIIGVLGSLIPVIPGTLIVWGTIILYALAERANGYESLDPFTLIVVSLIAIVAGLSDIWLPLLGAKSSGRSKRSVIFGFVGGIVGTFLIPIPIVGMLIGYVIGLFLGEYHKVRDGGEAIRAGMAGLATWGAATLVQTGGSLLMFVIFIWQVLAYQA